MWLPEKQKALDAAAGPSPPSAAAVGAATPLGSARSGAAKSPAVTAGKRTSERAKVRFFFMFTSMVFMLLRRWGGNVFARYYVFKPGQIFDLF